MFVAGWIKSRDRLMIADRRQLVSIFGLQPQRIRPVWKFVDLPGLKPRHAASSQLFCILQSGKGGPSSPAERGKIHEPTSPRRVPEECHLSQKPVGMDDPEIKRYRSKVPPH